MKKSLARAAVAVGAAAAMTMAAQPAHAETPVPLVVCDTYVTINDIQLAQFVNCVLDVTGTLLQDLGATVGGTISHIGTCVFFYDPLLGPFPGTVVSATVAFANCLA